VRERERGKGEGRERERESQAREEVPVARAADNVIRARTNELEVAFGAGNLLLSREREGGRERGRERGGWREGESKSKKE